MGAMATVEQHQISIISLTESAAAKIKELMAEEPDARPRSCASPSRAAAAPASSTRSASTAARRRATASSSCHGVPVVVDPFSAPYLPARDRLREGLQESGFKINNPNVSGSCGCGHSFQVEEGEGAPRRRRLRLRLLALEFRRFEP